MTSSATPTDAAPPTRGDDAEAGAAESEAEVPAAVEAAAPPPDDAEAHAASDADEAEDDADEADDAAADEAAARKQRADDFRSLHLFRVQVVVFLALVAIDLIAHGFEPPEPGEIGMIALPAIVLGHVLAYVLRDLRQQRELARAKIVAPPVWNRHLPRLVAVAAVMVGWGFVGWHERFRITPPTVFLALGWLAVVEAVLFLWRTGFVTTEELDDADVRWWRPRGERDELEREKRSLLKAIKEIEFDREMGKTTDEDAGQIVRMYRARAIDVIKAIDELDGKGETTVRDEIERELRARIEVAGKSQKAKKKGKKAQQTEDAS
jgi:hypothetical protein